MSRPGPGSPPKLPAREACALGQRRKLCPGDLRMDAAAEAAIGAGNDVLAPDHVGVTHDAGAPPRRWRENCGGVPHAAGNEQLPRGHLHLLPPPPLMLVTHVARFD